MCIIWIRPPMGPSARHQCLIYDGSPSCSLPILAEAIREKLANECRCLYLDCPPMVAGIRSCLSALEIDVPQELARGSLVLSSEQTHLVDGRFDVDKMIRTLEDAIRKAVSDGYRGLWASGDMSWEFGPEHNFDKLLEYEWRLEQLFFKQPTLSGICQYHRYTLPREAVRRGLGVAPAHLHQPNPFALESLLCERQLTGRTANFFTSGTRRLGHRID